VITAAEARRHLAAGDLEPDPDTGCLLWPTPAPTGYGPFLAFFEAVHGAVPAGLDVVHRCGGGPRGCVRPSHMDVVPAGGRVDRDLRAASIRDPGRRRDWQTMIRDEREARTMDRETFARELGVAPSTIRAWEDGSRVPAPDTAASIARLLSVGARDRKWVVTLVVQEVVMADTAGHAVTKAKGRLEREDRPLKSAVFRVQLAGRRRRRRVG
jgi:DNA-binding XRE family transcriptional regulator